jgi:hypothetical protein
VLQLNSGFDIWEKLKLLYGAISKQKVVTIHGEFYGKRLGKKENIEAHCNFLEKRRYLLKDTDFKIGEEAMASQFTNTIGSDWNPFVTVLNATFRDNIDQDDLVRSPTYENYKRRVIKEHNRLKSLTSTSHDDQNRGAMSSNRQKERMNRKGKECSNCKILSIVGQKAAAMKKKRPIKQEMLFKSPH